MKKSVGAYVYPPARGPPKTDTSCNRFTLGLNAAKNTHYIKKCFKYILFKIKFTTKRSVGAHVYLPLEWSKGLLFEAFWNIIYNFGSFLP